MWMVTLLGTFAAICSTASFAPQAWKIIKTRQTQDISVGMYLLTVTGFAAWTSYGILLRQWPLIASNAVCLCLSGFILMMELLPQKEKDEVCDALEDEIEPGRR